MNRVPRSSRIPSVARLVKELIYGPEPIGAAAAGQLAGYNRRAFGHTPASTIAHVFMKGEADVTYLGYVSSPQEFVGAVQMGANRGVSVQAYPALPNDAAPPALPAVQALLDPFSQGMEAEG